MKPFEDTTHRYLTTHPYYSIPGDDFHVIIYGLKNVIQKLESVNSLRLNQNSIRGNKIQFELTDLSPTTRTYDEACTQFFDSICELLEIVGTHVFYVEICTSASSINCKTLYCGLQRCLNFLPNLRSMMIAAVTHVPYNAEENFVRNLTAAYPLPELPYFTVFDFRVNGLPRILQNHIFGFYGGSIQKLSLMSIRNINTFGQLPNLSELELYRINNMAFLLNTLREMARFDIRLQKFVGETNVECNILDVLRELQPFDIREVRLRRIGIESGSLEENGYDLEPIMSLHTLEIEDGPYVTYNFLSKLPNLEFLYVRGRIQYQDTGYPYEPIVRYELNMQLHDCVYFCIPPPASFWKKFPSLRELYIMDEDIEYARRENLTYRFPRDLYNALNAV